MNQTLDPVFASGLRRELVAQVSAPTHRVRRRALVVGVGVMGVLTLGGVAAVAGSQPPGVGVTQPLAPPVVVNSVGPANVVLPPVPQGALYVRLELTCYDGLKCNTPGGGATRDADTGIPMVQRDDIPLTDAHDPRDAQRIPPYDPAVGVHIDVNPGTHWRLYAVYTDQFVPGPATAGDGRTVGIPAMIPPDLVPMVATNGRNGYVDYRLLTDAGHPTLTADGTSQPSVPVYDVDGTTVIGYADVSKPLH